MAITNKNLASNLITTQGFSGSYRPDEMVFLLKKVDIAPTDVKEKEKLIQSGEKHYSQMISVEKAPTDRHMSLYEQALLQGEVRLAKEVQQIAQTLVSTFTQIDQPIVLVSFVRAGAPLGVMLYHAIQDLGRSCVHYGISIIRDRGIDFAALETIIAKHGSASIVFVDGWTGKGAISKELQRSLGQDSRFVEQNLAHARDILPLVVLSDIGGCAWLSASADDWLIPSGILGSTVSGLISRSICEDALSSALQVDEDNIANWHGCIEYSHLEEHDQSVALIERINKIRQGLDKVENAVWSSAERQAQHAQTQQVIQHLAEKHQIQNLNRIKPGIAEATRAILRRVPDLVLLRYADDEDTALLRHLTKITGTPIKIVGDEIAPYRAVTLIQKLGAG